MKPAAVQSEPTWGGHLLRLLTPPRLGPDPSIVQWREWILFFLLGPGLLLGMAAYFMALPSLLTRGLYQLVLWDAVVLVLTITVFILRRLPWRLRAWFVVAETYSVGLVILANMGPISGGLLWLFAFALIGGVLLGLRAALFGLLVNAITLATVSWVLYHNLASWAKYMPYELERWPVIAISFLLLNAVTVMPTSMLVRGLESTILRQRKVSQELDQERARLDQEVFNRRAAQAALAESEQKYRLVTENISDVIWVLDLAENHLTYVSPSVQMVLGYTPEEASRLSLEQILSPGSHELAMATLTKELELEQQGADSSRPKVLELEHRRKDGGVILAEVPVRFMRDEAGQPTAVLGASRDITERKRAQEALRRSERRYRELFDSISDIIYTQDLEGRFLSVNQATADLFGYPAAEIVGKKASDFMPLPHRERFTSVYLATVRDKGHMSGVARYEDREGNQHYIEYRSTLSRPKDGEPYISGMGRDVTDRVTTRRQLSKLRSQLLQSQKMEAVGTLAGGVAHDFNNVLAVMMGYTELVLAELRPNDPHRYKLEQVLNAGQRASAVVKQILSFSRGQDSGRAPLALQPLVQDGLDLLRASLPSNLEMRVELKAPQATVMADGTQMHQVLMNLVTNAYHALREKGGVLTVRLEEKLLDDAQARDLLGLNRGRYLCLEVSDNGPGMPPEVLARVFDPFFTTKEVGEGSGLGLAVVHGIVKRHGGAMEVRSQAGQGASFMVYLPCLPQGDPEQPVT